MTAGFAPIVKVPVVTHVETGTLLYALQPKQFQVFEQTPVYRGPGGPRYIGMGGAAGGGKSYLSRAVAAAVAFAWPRSSTIIFRGTEDEIDQNHIQPFLLEVPPEIDGVPIYSYNGEKRTILWGNGSRTKFGFLRNDRDVQTYLGAAYDCMIFDEATTYTFFQVSYLGSRLRATVPGTHPFSLYPSNPGNRGHQWYKRWFIERRFRSTERPANYWFLQMFLKDNQELMQRDPDYITRLDQMQEPWRSWQRDGNWSAGAGTAFPELDYERHCIRPFEVPLHWRRFGAFDWGFNHPWSFGDYVVNEDGKMFCVETLRGHHQADYLIAERIREQADRPGLPPLREIVAGHDCWAVQEAHRATPGPSVADLFADYQLWLIQADIGRKNGYRQVRTRLQGPPPDPEPQLVWFDTLGNRKTLGQLELMVTDEHDLEDVRKVDADEYGEGGDDDYDQVRYASSHHPGAAASRPGTPFGISAPATLAAEHERLYRRRTDLRAKTAQADRPPAFGEDYE